MRWSWFIAGVMTLGCTIEGEQIRKFTYAPEFRYYARADVRSAMHELAHNIEQLRQQLEAEKSTPDNKAVQSTLENMIRIANELDNAGLATNHLRMANHIDDFRRHLNQALVAAQAEPPNYFLAGALTGECLACHRR